LQIIDYEGTRQEFPDDFTQADIARALASLSQATQPEVPQEPSFLDQASQVPDKAFLAAGPGPWLTKQGLDRFFPGVAGAIGGAIKGTDEEQPFYRAISPVVEAARGFKEGVMTPGPSTPEDVLTPQQQGGLLELRKILGLEQPVSDVPVPGGFAPAMSRQIQEQLLTPEQVASGVDVASMIAPIPGVGQIGKVAKANVSTRLLNEANAAKLAEELSSSLSLGEALRPLLERNIAEQAYKGAGESRALIGKQVAKTKQEKQLLESLLAERESSLASSLPGEAGATGTVVGRPDKPAKFNIIDEMAPRESGVPRLDPLLPERGTGVEGSLIPTSKTTPPTSGYIKTQQELESLLSNAQEKGSLLVEQIGSGRTAKLSQQSIANPRTIISQSTASFPDSRAIDVVSQGLGQMAIDSINLTKGENLLPFIQTNREKFKPFIFSASKKLKNLGDNAIELADRELATEITARSLAGPLVVESKKTFGILDDAGRRRVMDVLEDESKFKDLHITKGADEVAAYDTVKRLLNEAGKYLGETGATTRTSDGVREFAMLKNYFPHKWNEKDLVGLRNLLNSGDTEKIAAEMVKGGKFSSMDLAKESLRKFIMRQTERRIGSQHERSLKMTRAEFEQYGLPQPRYDADVLPEYFDEISRKIAENKYYGPEKEKLLEIVNALAEKHGPKSRQVEVAKDFMDTALRLNSPIHAARTIRLVNSFVLSPTTAVLQTAQSLIPAARGSTVEFMTGFAKAFTKQGEEAALTAGIGLKDTERMYQKALGLTTSEVQGLLTNTAGKGVVEKVRSMITSSNKILEQASSTYMEKLGIKKADLFARKTAVNVAQETAKAALNKLIKDPRNTFANNFFKDYGLGLDVNKAVARGKLNQFELNRIAQMFERETNFWYLTGDLPLFMSHEMGKTVFQFMPSAYLQSAFIKRAVVDYSVKRLDPSIAFKLFVAQEIGGEIHGDTKALFRLQDPTVSTDNRPGIERPSAFAHRLWDNVVSQGVGFGLASNIGEQLVRNKVGNMILGPTSGLADTANRFNKIGSEALSGDASIGKTINESLKAGLGRVGAAAPLVELLKTKKQRNRSSILGGER